MLLKYNLTLYYHRATVMDIKNKKENTMKPFETGDIFLGCTELIDDIDEFSDSARDKSKLSAGLFTFFSTFLISSLRG